MSGSALADWIGNVSGKKFQTTAMQAVGGGSINRSFRLDGTLDGRPICYFVKFNDAGRLPMFEAEADGLRELALAAAVRVPEPVGCGVLGERSFLITGFINFSSGSAHASALLGEQLAAMHRYCSDAFGWRRDNTIGLTRQENPLSDNWLEFYRDYRLGVQLTLAEQNGFAHSLLAKGARLQADLGALFDGYSPQSSLLHGDLWAGNYAFDREGLPVLFDPAVYYGDRESDLAMTELFGGFDDDFYAAYRNAWPLDDGYQQRRGLYQLYHILNHANLFAGSYAVQAESLLDNLLAGVRS